MNEEGIKVSARPILVLTCYFLFSPAIKNHYHLSIEQADGGTDMDIENRINKARAAFGMLSVVWRNNNFSASLKLRLFKSSVVSVLLYGCYMVSKAVTSRMQVFTNRCGYFPYLLTKSYCKWGTASKSRNWTSRNSDQETEMDLDWPHPAQRWRQYSTHGDGVEFIWWFRKSSEWTVPDLEKSSWAGDKNAWEEWASAEMNS